MDRNTILGLLLILSILFAWMFWFGPKPDPKPQIPPQSDHVIVTDSQQVPVVQMPDSVNADSLVDAGLRASLGDFYLAGKGTAQDVTVETDRFIAIFSTQGAALKALYLKEHVTFDGKPLPVINPSAGNRFSFQFAHGSHLIQTADLFYRPTDSGKVVITGESEKTISFIAPVGAEGSGKFFALEYTFRGNTFDYGVTIHMKGLNGIVNNDHIDLLWTEDVPKTEMSVEKMRERATVVFYSDESSDKFNPGSSDPEEERLVLPTEWISFRSQFFSHILLSEKGKPFESANISMTTPANQDIVRIMEASVSLPVSHQPDEKIGFRFYAGPNDFRMLKAYERQLDENLDYGWYFIGWINKYMVIPVFKFLEGSIGNYGIIIFLLAVIIKIVLFPLTHTSYKSMAKMRVINQQPEVKALEEKYKEDPMALSQERMKYYREAGVSPFGGCLPMVIQYPFLIAMFSFFPASFELRQQSFLWAHDLSTYDSILDLPFKIPFYGDHVSLFTLLMTVSIYIFTFMSQQSQGAQANPVLKYMPYIMPVVFLGFLNNYAAGLSYYYFISNVLAITQTMVTKQFIDDKKLLEQIHSAAKRKKAKPGFLQGWVEKQQKAQEELRKRNRK